MSRDQKQDKAKIIEALGRMPNVEVACKMAGVPRPTHYRWAKEDLEYASKCNNAIEHSRAMVSAVAESHVVEGVKSGDKTYNIFWLKNHHAAYRTRPQLVPLGPPEALKPIIVVPLEPGQQPGPDEKFPDIVDTVTGERHPWGWKKPKKEADHA